MPKSSQCSRISSSCCFRMSSSHTYQDSSFILGASKNLVLAYTVGMQKKKPKPSNSKISLLKNEVPPQLLKYCNVHIQIFFRGQPRFDNVYHSNTHH